MPLRTLLSNAGLVTDPNIKNDLLGKYLVATGSDGYKAVIALGEIAPRFGNRDNLVAYSSTDKASGPMVSRGWFCPMIRSAGAMHPTS